MGVRPPLATLFLACLAASSCAPDEEGGASDFPSPRELAALPLGLFDPDPDGPGYGAELVFARNATLASGGLLELEADALAVVRWLGVTPALVDDVALAVAPPAGVELATAAPSARRFPETTAALPDLSTFREDGTLLLAVRSGTASVLDLSLTFTPVTTLPSWTSAGSASIDGLPEPSGIDWDPSRDELVVVSDDGGVGVLDPGDFSLVAFEPVGGDLEAVRWVPGLDVTLILDEAASQILVLGAGGTQVLTIVHASGLDPVPIAGGDGFEGLAVTAVSGRTVELILANQNDPHCLYRGTATIPPPGTTDGEVVLTSAYPQPELNLSEVIFDWGSRQVLTLHGYVAQGTTLRLLDPTLSTSLDETTVPAIGGEGFTFHRAGAFLADDLGRVRRLAAVE